jgi:hypothetical protein
MQAPVVVLKLTADLELFKTSLENICFNLATQQLYQILSVTCVKPALHAYYQ